MYYDRYDRYDFYALFAYGGLHTAVVKCLITGTSIGDGYNASDFPCFLSLLRRAAQINGSGGQKGRGKINDIPFCIPFFRSQWANVMFNDEDPMIVSSWNGAFLVSGKSLYQS